MREAIIQLSDSELEAMGIKDIVAATREAGLQDITEMVCEGVGGIVQVQVDEPLPEEDFDDFEAVKWWEKLAETDSRVTYLFKIEPPDPPTDEGLDDHATAHEVSTVNEGGIELSVVGSQDEIGDSIAAINEGGLNPLLQRLTDFDGSNSPTVDSLTERQRETVEIAHEMGYYEVPRQASTDDIADEIGLDPSTVAEHLQRAEHNILGNILNQ
ncbi:MAG: helix-turn-helix domain-containing protein [Halobacteriaceae archaeon]